MADLGTTLRDLMRRRGLTPQAIADRTGIRTPRIRAFAEDGSDGPVRPTRQEVRELHRLAAALAPGRRAAHPVTARTAGSGGSSGTAGSGGSSGTAGSGGSSGTAGSGGSGGTAGSGGTEP